MNQYKQQVRDFFNNRTAYDAEGKKHPQEADKLLKSVPLETGDRILDLATGTGLIAIAAAQIVGETGLAIGVDLSSGMLQQAREKIAYLGLNNLELREIDVELIDFEPESFDNVFCCSAITYFSDIPKILHNCYHWLKTGGYFAFTCPAASAYLASLQIEICDRVLGIALPHINEPLSTPEKCQNLLKQTGFKDIQLEVEPSGKYLAPQDFWVNSLVNSFYPRGNPLANLSGDRLELLQTEYQQALQQLVTEEGIWYDGTTFFIRVRK
jgi:arsenite methyltransferase